MSERVFFDPPARPSEAESWWGRYSSALVRLTSTSRTAVEVDSRYIVDRGIFGEGVPGAQDGPTKRVRTGLVMGSVQSGKTASMLGVTAKALDRGADIVVVLAGTRLSLWRQTYERLVDQLDPGDETAAKVARRLLCPPPGVALAETATPLEATYRMNPAQVRLKLKNRQPIIVVAMKQTNHLYALGASLRSSVFSAVSALDRAVHMLVIDDEADDGSVLDAVVEAGQHPLFGNLKQIPRAIADLWEPRGGQVPQNLFATYVGYTATPQANLLQEDQNPLAPKDFLATLRTPLDVGQPVVVGSSGIPRSSTYPEPAGLRGFYTGGEIYYNRSQRTGLCMETTGQPVHDLGEAVRAFLVANAIRLHRSGRLGPHSAAQTDFATASDASELVAPPTSMLYHPSANVVDHFSGAEEILVWAGVTDQSAARSMIESGDARLPQSLVDQLLSDDAPWSVWVDRYRQSAHAVHLEFNTMDPNPVPDWPVVKDLLIREVIPGTRVAVVNSDPNADDRPIYQPRPDEASGRWLAARDLSTIFVSGNVMARGLTLEGMTTALFLRASSTPFADTQMQMQRWFGYRGDHIELCRLFATKGQLSLFRAYHDIDEAVRSAIAEKMADGAAPDPVVLQGLGFLATGKIANLGQKSLCPGAKPFVRLVSNNSMPDPNVDVVADLFTSNLSQDVRVGNTTRGRILASPLSLRQAAAVLERFVFGTYRPGSATQLGELWSGVQARVAATLPLPDAQPFYRPPEPTGDPSPARRNCPYTIAAYLRLWDSCLSRAVRGLFVNGSPGDLWALANLAGKAATQPRFWVGIRFGGGSTITGSPLADLSFSIPSTTRNVEAGELANDWGTNNPNAGPNDYRGDEFFDYYHRRDRIPAMDSGWRPAGSDGQILFYINKRAEDAYPTVAVGVCIPAGGPEQFAAIRAGAVGD